jgi:hypothetical protein
MSELADKSRGLDASGVPVIDPTANVIALVQANKESADAVNAMRDRYIAAEIGIVRETVKWMEKLADTHQKHDYALHKAEAGRLDALRQNDREDVKVLAAQTTAKAEALQSQAVTMADTLAKTFAANLAEQNKRLSAIERQQAEGVGKQAVVDPQMERLVSKIDALVTSRDAIGGEKFGRISQQQVITWVLGVIVSLLLIANFLKK